MSFEPVLRNAGNPYVDNIIYYLQVLSLGTILKNEQEADANETVESIKNAELYIHCVENTATFDLFEGFTSAAIKAAEPELVSKGIIISGLDPLQILMYTKDKNTIPEEYREIIVKYQVMFYAEDYEEINEYYRMLIGEPPRNSTPVKINPNLLPDYLSNLKPYVSSTYVQDMNVDIITILDKAHVFDGIKASDPEGTRFIDFRQMGITPYRARRAPNFSPLYVPSIKDSSNDLDSIREMYIETLNINRNSVMYTVYSEAFKYGSDHYDSFISTFIILTSVINVVSRIQEFIVDRDVFDIQTLKMLFEVNGVTYFDEIPFRYQRRLIKNIHKIIKTKSTSQNMIDICSMFGFDDIRIFRYFILKDRRINSNISDFAFILDENGNEDQEDNYELKFFKSPINEDVNHYILSDTYTVPYEQITDTDPTWDGDGSHELIKAEILNQDFTYMVSKYISIDMMLDAVKISTQQKYIYNILLSDDKLVDNLRLEIPFIQLNHKFKLSDTFVFLNTLIYLYNDLLDLIEDPSAILTVNGFNFAVNEGELVSYVDSKEIDRIEEGRLKESIIAIVNAFDDRDHGSASFIDFDSMIYTYNNNISIRNAIVDGMMNADSKRVYDIYNKLYRSMMETEMTMDFFKSPSGDYYRDEYNNATYTVWIKNNDSVLYDEIVKIRGYEDPVARNDYIRSLINNVVSSLDAYIDTNEFISLFSNLPASSFSSIQHYVAETINFFKSFKVDILGFSTLYTLDDREGALKLYDDFWQFALSYTKSDWITMNDALANIKSKIGKMTDNLKMEDMIYLDIFRNLDKFFIDRMAPDDSVYNTKISMRKSDLINESDDLYTVFSNYVKSDWVTMNESFNSIKNYYNGMKDKLPLNDLLFINVFRNLNRFFIDNYYLRDSIGRFNTSMRKSEYVTMRDEILITRTAV